MGTAQIGAAQGSKRAKCLEYSRAAARKYLSSEMETPEKPKVEKNRNSFKQTLIVPKNLKRDSLKSQKTFYKPKTSKILKLLSC